MTRKLNKELSAFEKMFDGECPLNEDIGLRCVFKKPAVPAQKDYFTVVAVQNNHKGELGYRLIGDGDWQMFGTPAMPDEVEFVDIPAPKTDTLYGKSVKKILKNHIAVKEYPRGIAVYYETDEHGFLINGVLYTGKAADKIRPHVQWEKK